MDFFDAVNARYSHRAAFLNQPIPDADIRQILEAGMKAPSGMNCQTTSFIAVTDPQIRAQIAEALPTPAVKTAPVIFVLLSEHKVTPCGMAFEVEDYAAASVSMQLAIAALGYETVWMDGMSRAPQTNQALRKILNIPEGKNLRTILPVGIPEQRGKQRERLPFEQRCTYNKF